MEEGWAGTYFLIRVELSRTTGMAAVVVWRWKVDGGIGMGDGGGGTENAK
jgi:hypothetical protein